MTFLYENEYISSPLKNDIESNKELYPFFEMTFQGIKPKNNCGFLKIQNKNYFIVPKIADKKETNLHIFIYMLMYVFDVKLTNSDFSNLQSIKSHFLEIFIRHFSDALLNEFKKGIFKKYVCLSKNLKVLRGKYVIEKNFTNFYHQNIYCEYDEFTMDNELNRFFLYAIKVFKKFSSYPNLHKCEMILDEVSFLHFSNLNQINIEFNRMNSRYLKSFETAVMILKKLIPLPNDDNNKSFAFLFDMSKVFEKFIGRLYQSIDSTTKLQSQGTFENLQLKPDILTSTMIIDTKYKIVETKDNLATSDKYQMFTYGTNFGIKNTMLLYPKHFNKDFKDDDLRLGDAENTIKLRLRSIDLEFNGNYDDFLQKMNDRVFKIINE
jgi:5-methylcytosine-specific restriction enzyme subunit McrC